MTVRAGNLCAFYRSIVLFISSITTESCNLRYRNKLLCRLKKHSAKSLLIVILGKEVSANCTSVTTSWLIIFCLALDKGFVEFV